MYYLCVGIIKKFLENKKGLHLSKRTAISRFCNKNNYNIVISGGRYKRRGVMCVHDVCSTSFKDNVTFLPQMKEEWLSCKTFCIKNELYVFGGLNVYNNSVTSVEKYSPAANAWERVAEMRNDRKHFCACTFMNNVYVIGGILCGYHQTALCDKFDTKYNKWSEVARMNDARNFSACAVFEGRIVVCG